MNILILEPYYTGSHKNWADGIAKNSKHQVILLTLKGQFWKLRMHGGAVTLAREFIKIRTRPDLILATDMLDLSTFLTLTRNYSHDIPVAVYFHENQLAYPWSPKDRDLYSKRDKHYGFINFTTALCADYILFNSEYNKTSFFQALPRFLNHYPDHRETGQIKILSDKSSVLPLGMDLSRFDEYKQTVQNDPPLILWNHRWEYDKNPESFFNVLYRLKASNIDFQIVLLGENYRNEPDEFINARQVLRDHILHWGYVSRFDDYAAWLWKSDVLPVTSFHDFFGASVCEAAYCDCIPLLPNRLSYPELFFDYPELFYENEKDLQNKLKDLLLNRPSVSAAVSVKPYDWSVLIEYYDTVFEHIIENRPLQMMFPINSIINKNHTHKLKR